MAAAATAKSNGRAGRDRGPQPEQLGRGENRYGMVTVKLVSGTNRANASVSPPVKFVITRIEVSTAATSTPTHGCPGGCG